MTGHVRSFSNCSKKGGELTTKRSGVSYNQSRLGVNLNNTTNNAQNITISES